ncbi:hypothetical protein NSMM_260033 [Nitrosomonas mobilis]|uniref:Uncharacterized protein n=1 Tax=Nitrosomonas mobilis TaxID=51642 RepID=A0A1G5SCM7_9PROT|nr:hypothetical protein NSMM_260033 [Nitrosomonas mobilis]
MIRDAATTSGFQQTHKRERGAMLMMDQRSRLLEILAVK